MLTSAHYTLHVFPQKEKLKVFKRMHLDSYKRLCVVEYIVIDEMSVVGRKMFRQVEQRLRQAFPQCSDWVLGGRSCLLFGDFGQLPPVMDLPLYTSVSKSSLSALGRSFKGREADWEHLMERRQEHVMNKDTFNKALHLLPTVNAEAEHNLDKLKQNGQQVAARDQSSSQWT